jgi:16S rRNA (uracil1498-N3)-methyltransferase
MTTAFYAPPEARRANQILLPPEEAAHAVRVLRARPGDDIEVVDGEGRAYRVRLDLVQRDHVSGTILEETTGKGEPPYHLTIALSPLKNPGRFETFVEKATELGVSRIIPLLTERTEKPSLNLRRVENILIAAMKQSGRSRRPILEEPTHLQDVVEGETADLRVICHEAVVQGATAGDPGAPATPPATILALIGPEGGFSEKEVSLCLRAGYLPTLLGGRRLRAETAGIAIATSFMLTYDTITNSP